MPESDMGNASDPLGAATLRPLLADSTACVSTGVVAGYSEDPPRMISHGNAAFLADERLAIFDNASNQVRLIGADGVELARLGQRGSGPGEFMLSPAVKAWPGDTLATYEPVSRRLQLFTQAGFARMVSLPAQGRGLFLGIFDSGWLAFRTSDEDLRPGRVRPTFSIARAREGDRELQTIRDGIPGTERFIDLGTRFTSSRTPAFPQQTSVVAAGSRIVIYDDALDDLQMIDVGGDSVGVVHLTMERPAVPRRVRDSVQSIFRRRGAGLTRAARDAFASVPERSAQIEDVRSDASGGTWLRFSTFYEPGGGLYVRLAPTGAIDRCFRPPVLRSSSSAQRDLGPLRFTPARDGRILAFSRDRVAVARINADSTTIMVLSTVRVPAPVPH